MTDNREIIEMLKMLKEQALKSHNDTAVLEVKIDSFNFVLDEAIKVLKQEPCEDCISRQAVNEGFKKYANSSFAYGCMWDYINKLPSVAPKEKTGHWVNAKVGKLFPSNDYKCSECGNILDFDGVNCGRGDANYCPNCGARMVSE